MLIRLERVTPYFFAMLSRRFIVCGATFTYRRVDCAFLVVFFAVGIVKPSCVNQASNIAYCTHSTPFFTHSQGAFCAVRWRWRVKGIPFDPCRPARCTARTQKAPSRGKGKALLGVHLEYAQQAVCIFCAFDITLAYLFGRRYNIPCKLG